MHTERYALTGAANVNLPYDVLVYSFPPNIFPGYGYACNPSKHNALNRIAKGLFRTQGFLFLLYLTGDGTGKHRQAGQHTRYTADLIKLCFVGELYSRDQRDSISLRLSAKSTLSLSKTNLTFATIDYFI